MKCDIYRIIMARKSDSRVLDSQKVMELKKHVAVIHSSNKLTLLQRKIANALLFNAYGELQEKEEHTIHIGKLCELIGYDSNDHKTIKLALVNLLSTVLEWNLVDGERLDTEGIWNASSIIADASIDGAICTYSYSNKMRKLLYRPNMYGRLDMLVQSKFQSGYGLALYENCNRFQDIGQTPWFSLMKFRQLMGVEQGKYKIFRDFKTRVLDKAVEEVNKYSTLNISPQLRKQNRQVTCIQFLIKKTNVISIANHEEQFTNDTSLENVLKLQFGLSAKQIDETRKHYDEKYIKEKMELIQSSTTFKNGKVKNLARYLLSALRDDYQPNKQVIKDAAKAKERQPHKKKIEHDKLKQIEFRRFQDKQLLLFFQALDDETKLPLLKKFEKFLTGMYLHVYLRSGLENLLIQDQLCVFLRQIKHALVVQLINYETWLRNRKAE